MDVTMLLCDAADEVGGKLYVMGGGWTNSTTADIPTSMALAIRIGVPWEQANQKHTIRALLLDHDGEPVQMNDETVGTAGAFEVGRPPGQRKGAEIPAAFALRFAVLVLPAGGYVWELSINDVVEARAPFMIDPAPA